MSPVCLRTWLAATDVATQMGNQGSSLAEGVDLICEWIWNGEIGDGY